MYEFNLPYTSCFDLAAASQYERNTTRDDFVGNLSGLLTKSFSVPATTAEAIAYSLLFRMGDARLHYHTPVHILGIFQFYEGLQDKPLLTNLQQLALWFHDAIYLPDAPANVSETQSANFAIALMHPWLKNQADFDLQRMILATAFHDSNLSYPFQDEQILDLDIWNFSVDFDTFQCMGELIRQEFAHVDDAAFAKGRAAFMRKMNEKPSIYRTPYFKQHFESAARANIKKVLENV